MFRPFRCSDPLEKAESYVALRRPYLLNDLRMQRTLMDRRRVYDLLEESGIDVPRHVFMSRDGYASTGTGDGNRHDRHGGGGSDADGVGSARPRASSFAAGFEPEVDEHDDHIEVTGVIINKPFVEKPVDADDHNIAIYYPSSAGGGCKKLFRKVGDRSSEFYPEINEIRRDGSYIYETFMETQGTDVKVRRQLFHAGGMYPMFFGQDCWVLCRLEVRKLRAPGKDIPFDCLERRGFLWELIRIVNTPTCL